MAAQPVRTDPQPSERRRHDVERFLRWLGADEPLAADLAQETLLRLWQRPPRGRDEATIAAWVRTVARNLFRSAAASERPGVPLDDAALLEAAWRRFTERDRDGALGAALADCLERLPERTRRTVELHYREGLSHEELAAALGRTTVAVRSLLQRTRARLADCIDERTQR